MFGARHHGAHRDGRSRRRAAFLIGFANALDISGNTTRAQLAELLRSEPRISDREAYRRDAENIRGDWRRAVAAVTGE
jgi:hypothetical protein